MSEEKIIDIMGKAFTEYQKAYRSNEDEVGVVYPRNEYKDVITYMVSKIWPQFEHLQAQLAKLQWVKVSERLPKNMDTVLVIENGNNPKQGYYGKERRWYIWVNAWCLTSKVTHWKLIDFPDKEKSDE